MNVQDITVDLSKKNVKPESIVLRQGDKSGTTLRVKVLDNGVNVSSLNGYTAKFIMKLPYNRFYYEVEGTISGSMLTFLIDESLAAVEAGVTNIAYVALVNGDVTRMSANNIRVEILPSALDGFTPPPEWTDPIDEFIEEQTARVDTIVENAESATTAANTAATNANDKAGLADEAATNANAKAQEADEAAEAADAAREAIQDDLAAKANKDGHHPLLGAGASDALMSTDGEVDTFARRVSEHDGACKIVSMRGNTVRWNQLANRTTSATLNGVTLTLNADGTITLNGTATAGEYFNMGNVSTISGHKYLMKGCPVGGGSNTYYFGIAGAVTDTGVGGIQTGYNLSTSLRFTFKQGATFHNVTTAFICVDLTAMFGAGNEPATVEEFERQYPESYYPYDAGSLLSVNVEGVKSVGFNRLNIAEDYNSTNFNLVGANTLVNKLTDTNSNFNLAVYAYRNGVFIKTLVNASNLTTGKYTYIFNTNNLNIDEIRCKHNGSSRDLVFFSVRNFERDANYCITLDVKNTNPSIIGGLVVSDFCINISDSALNGTYRPYREITREIPPSTLFPDGILRSAGTAYDERTPTRDIKRVGVVDLGSLNWTYSSASARFNSSAISDAVSVGNRKPIECPIYQYAVSGNADKTVFLYNGTIIIYDASYDSNATELKSALSGVYAYYELATPTETAIDPPLNLTYPTEQGGTESIVIPTGKQSAAPTMAVVYAYNADGVRDLSQAVIANIEGATASTNYSVGGYFVHAGKLYRATSAIATGETINPGTNCTQTTVMAELLALTA